MSGNTPLDAIPLWALFLLAFVPILLAHESGFRLGRARAHGSNKENDVPLGGMVAAQLGLLAFLLAFTFGIATSRFDNRRQVLLDEANAIGTAYLRAAMLPEPHRAEVHRLLREYVDVRIAAAQGGAIDDAIRQSEELHRRLWAETVAVAEKDPRSIPIGLFAESINEVIDLHAKRVTAGLRNRIPTTVWGVLFLVAILSFTAIGYQGGLTGTRRSPAVLMIALTFAAVIWLVANLDRWDQGFLRVSQQPMIELRHSMEARNR
jgi:hypothetical protein